MNNYFSRSGIAAALIAIVVFANGCNKSASFSLLPQSDTFQQSSVKLNNKIDILWVIDNSASMDPLQTELVANYQNFITRFQTLGLDYKMAVTTTDAYLSEPAFRNNPQLARFRDGLGSNVTGYYYITPTIPNIVPNFVTNSSQGSGGSGDERAFQSMFDSLNSPLNAGFLRPDAQFAVVILSDEDDFSDPTRPEYSWTMTGGLPDHDYANPRLPPVSQVIQQLDNLTLSMPNHRNYSVSAITVKDSACQQSHAAQSPVTIVGQRYIELANATNGVVGSVCDANYAQSLNFIQERIVELATAFQLSQVPQISTLSVVVDGSVVPNDPTNGWTYDSVSNAIQFHGSAVPSASANIAINFTPTTLR